MLEEYLEEYKGYEICMSNNNYNCPELNLWNFKDNRKIKKAITKTIKKNKVLQYEKLFIEKYNNVEYMEAA